MLFALKTPEGEKAFYHKGVINYEDFKNIFSINPEVL